MKILLAGSPSIAVPAFKKIIKNFEVVGIITQPDRPKGRGKIVQQTPVALLGQRYDIKVFKPNKMSEIEQELKKLKFDLLLTFAFGQWIPTSILSLGTRVPLNIHGSLLPEYRGAAPIQRAILDGKDKIGITLMTMVEEMDAGQMWVKAWKEITPETSSDEAFKIISELAEDNIVKWLNNLDSFSPEEQGSNFTLAPKIVKSEGELLETLDKEKAYRIVYAYNSNPGAFRIIDGKRLKIYSVSKFPKKNAIILKFNNGTLFAVDFQWEGKKRVQV